jgi:hypothetical protein
LATGGEWEYYQGIMPYNINTNEVAVDMLKNKKVRIYGCNLYLLIITK